MKGSTGFLDFPDELNFGFSCFCVSFFHPDESKVMKQCTEEIDELV